MPNLLVKDVPDELLKRFKHRLDHDGWIMRLLFLQLMDDYAQGRLRPSQQPPGGNPARDRYRTLFGILYDDLQSAPDWWTISDRDRGERLRQAWDRQETKYGRPQTEQQAFDFTVIARRLALPDAGQAAYVFRCPMAHTTSVRLTLVDLENGLERRDLVLFCSACGRSYPPAPSQELELIDLAKRERLRTE